jgi:hypothetical protein
MSLPDVLQFAAVIGPGFVMLKVLYLFGGQHRRLEWEWVVWSALIGLVLLFVSTTLAGIFAFVQGPVPLEAAIGLTSFTLAVLSGAGFAWGWEQAKRVGAQAPLPEGDDSARRFARRLHRWVSDSAWDFVLDEADRRDNGVEVITEVDGKEVAYYGALDTFGQEVAEAEPWVYLTYVYRWDPDKGYLPMSELTEGMLFHRDHIKRMRFIAKDKPQEVTTPVFTGLAVAQAGAAVGTGTAHDATVNATDNN